MGNMRCIGPCDNNITHEDSNPGLVPNAPQTFHNPLWEE
jgi:hypothetical protein